MKEGSGPDVVRVESGPDTWREKEKKEEVGKERRAVS